MGRVLKEQKLEATPIDTAGFGNLCKITELTTADSFDLFYALYKHTPSANEQIAKLREAVSQVERQLAAKEAYVGHHLPPTAPPTAHRPPPTAHHPPHPQSLGTSRRGTR